MNCLIFTSSRQHTAVQCSALHSYSYIYSYIWSGITRMDIQTCPIFFVENIQKHPFFGKNWLVNEFRTVMGGGLLGISKKIISIIKTWQKIVTKFGQFKKLKWPFSSLQFCIFFCWKYTELSILLEKLIGQWIPDRNGWGIAEDIKKKLFSFSKLTKNGNKAWTI